MKLAHPVVQTNLHDKTKYICERRIDLYYGDSDSDITAAVAAGATPVRVERASNSYAKDATPFSEFIWADYFRRRLKWPLVDQHYERSVAKAMLLARAREASFMPGWSGPDHVDRR